MLHGEGAASRRFQMIGADSSEMVAQQNSPSSEGAPMTPSALR
jgi:hypothetical protein